MKKLVLVLTTIALLVALAIPALAEMSVPGTIILPETVSGLSGTGYSFTKGEYICTIQPNDETDVYADYSGDNITGVSYSWAEADKRSVFGVYSKNGAGAWKLAMDACVLMSEGEAGNTAMGVYTADGKLIFDAVYHEIYNVYVRIVSKANVSEDAVYCLPLAGDAYEEIPPIILAGQWDENQWYRIDLDHNTWTCSWTKVDSALAHAVPSQVDTSATLNLTGKEAEPEKERIVVTKEELRAALESPSVSSIIIKPEEGALIDVDWNATLKGKLSIIPNQGFTSLRIAEGGSLTLASGAHLSTVQQGGGTGQIWLDGGKLDASAGAIDAGSIIYWRSGDLIAPASMENVFLIGGACDEASVYRFAKDRRIGLLVIQGNITLNEDVSINMPVDVCDGATLTVCSALTINEDWELLVESGCTLVIGQGGSIAGKYTLEEGASFVDLSKSDPVIDPTPSIDPALTGFTMIDGEKTFVSGGAVVELDGLVNDPANTNDWYYCWKGKVLTDVTSLVLYNEEWFYVTDGKLDTTKAGIVEYNGGRFFVAAGRLLREVTGLIQDPAGTGWYFCSAGQIHYQYTGLALYDGAWFYVVNGKLDEGFTGYVDYDGATFYVLNGMLVA